MTEFKQIIGRGTRLREDEGKTHFVIMDFRNVTKLFADPDWDGIIEESPDYPPIIVEPPIDNPPHSPIEPPPPPPPKPPKPVVDANGCRVKIIGKIVSIYDTNGKLLKSESIEDYSKSNILGKCASLDNFINMWTTEAKKEAIKNLLLERGINLEQMKMEHQMTDVDDFDFICHVAYDQKPLTRKERANNVKKRDFLSKYSGIARKILEALLDRYMNFGIYDIENATVLKLDPFTKFGTPAKIVNLFGEIYENILRELQNAGSSGEFYTPRTVTDFMAQMINPQIGEKIADFACGTGGFLTSALKYLKLQTNTPDDIKKYNNAIFGIEKKQFPYILCITNMLLHDIDVPKIYHDNTLLHDVLDYGEKDQFDVILMNPPYGGHEKNDVKNHFPADLASSETADLFMSVIMYRLKKNGRAAVILPDGFLFGTDNAKVAIKKKLLKEFNLHTVVRLPHSVFAPYTSITTNILFFNRTGETKKTWFYRLDMPEGYKNFSKTKPMKLEHFTPAVQWWNNREEMVVDDFDKAKKYTLQQLADRNYNIDLCGYPHEEEEILAPKELIQQYQEKRDSLNADIDRTLKQITDILGIDFTGE